VKSKYDVIIIGAGVGGLTCGCYLAKNGMHVLIIEKNNKVGGCCSSFIRNGVEFDAGVHSIGSCREEGILGSIFKELDLINEIKLYKKKPSNIILTENNEISIGNTLQADIKKLSDIFPKESKNIKSFLTFVNSFNINSKYEKNLRNENFANLLRQYFKNDKLITFFEIMLLNIGVPAANTSCLSAIILFREFIMDGGYYPTNGTQFFSNTIAKKFRKYGGEIALSKTVTKIKVKRNRAIGVNIGNRVHVSGKCIVSNIDARQTYFKLIGKKILNKSFVNKINQLVPTCSIFTIYLGLSKQLKYGYQNTGSIWKFPTKTFNKDFNDVYHGRIPYLRNGFTFFINDISRDSIHENSIKTRVYILITASYQNKNYWKRNKNKISDYIIKNAANIFPAIISNIKIKEVATPIDIEKFTGNYKGAMSGWAFTPAQTQYPTIRRNSSIQALYMTGHWVNQLSPGGVPSVAFMGKKTAKLVELRESVSKR